MTKMTNMTCAAVVIAVATTIASAHHENDNANTTVQPLSTVPESDWTVTQWLKQSVYDMGDNKIGDIKDVLLDHDGKVSAVIVGVGGFLGVGARDVAVPYASVQFKSKDQKWYPVMNTTKDALGMAQAFKYDQNAMKWMPETPPTTEGRSTPLPSRPPKQ